MTYLTSPLSIPNPNAIVAQIQLQYRIRYGLRALRSDHYNSLDFSFAPSNMDYFFLGIVYSCVVHACLYCRVKLRFIWTRREKPAEEVTYFDITI